MKKIISILVLVVISKNVFADVSAWNGWDYVTYYHAEMVKGINERNKEIDLTNRHYGKQKLSRLTIKSYCKKNSSRYEPERHYCQFVNAGGNVGQLQNCFDLNDDAMTLACDRRNAGYYRRLGLMR